MDPYHAFLRDGHVQAWVADPAEWRAEIRRQARRDKISMRSFVMSEREGLTYVWAGQARDPTNDELAAAVHHMSVGQEARDRAQLRGHDLRWICVAHGEGAGRCSRCGARAYINSTEDPPVMNGDVYETNCRSG